MSDSIRQLHRLAASWNVQTAYYDVGRRRRTASPQALLGILAALGSPVASLDDVPQAMNERRKQQAERLVEPVIVAWDGKLEDVALSLPGKEDVGQAQFHLELEQGETYDWAGKVVPTARKGDAAADDQAHALRHCVARFELPPPVLPWGYHRLSVEASSRSGDSLLISAPVRAYWPSLQEEKAWGVFAPLYALHSEASWGGGNFSDLERLWKWTTGQGGDFVATLPMLATYLEEPCDFSPYTPASRLFWNELFLDIRQVPELARCEPARALLQSSEFQQELSDLRGAPLVDYRRRAKLQRRVLELLCRTCFEDGSGRRESLEEFQRQRPQVEDYARFRAVTDRQQALWLDWPERLRDGNLKPDDYDTFAARYHAYVQWLAHEQIHRLTDEMRGLYLDLPLGVHRGGYDTWRHREAFALDVSAGAPPDAFFTKGQNWDLPPLHPERLRERGYAHFRGVLRHHLEHAEMLRIDHVMQLHRLYWVPRGMDARDGTYVRYRPDELYAILCLESHRHCCRIVGENLGTVPSQVNAAMRRHAVRGMHVAQYEMRAGASRPLGRVPQRCVASLNTHDVPMFGAFWSGDDLDLRQELGLFDEAETARQREERRQLRGELIDFLRDEAWLESPQPEPEQVLDALHAYLAASPAEIVLINAEDLWLEKNPQNTPGTGDERPNWRRKMAHSLDELERMEVLESRLRRVAEVRRAGDANLQAQRHAASDANTQTLRPENRP